MPLDYTPLVSRSTKWTAFATPLSVDDLRDETHTLYDRVSGLLDQCTDFDIAFVPHDPDANDPDASVEAERHIGWTIGHIIAHITASNEEAGCISSLLARGIPFQGRLRAEVDWREVNTVERARQRLEESRRMTLAYLDAWHDDPDLETLRTFSSERATEYFGPINAKGCYMMGIGHMAEHIDQIEAVLEQAKMAAETYTS